MICEALSLVCEATSCGEVTRDDRKTYLRSLQFVLYSYLSGTYVESTA